MEPLRSWVLNCSKSNHLKPNLDIPVPKSREEEAFMEDATGPFGAFIWPPRSYSCDFCRREFSSAQALGGHMNIHRRDRARLKKPHSPQNAFLVDHMQTKSCFSLYNESSYDDDKSEEKVTCKRRRIAGGLSSPYPIDNHLQTKALRRCPSATEELDLELRLGY